MNLFVRSILNKILISYKDETKRFELAQILYALSISFGWFIEDGYRRTLDLLSIHDPYFLTEIAKPLIASMPEIYADYESEVYPFTVLKTPGHTPGSVSLYSESESVVFSGDTLFKGSAGRCDLGGSEEALLQSLKSLMKLPDETLVIPGHGPMTDIRTERMSNPFCKG